MTTVDQSRELIVGAYDCHSHVEPDLWPRSTNAYEYCQAARDVGMAGLVFKNHAVETASWASLLQVPFPDLDLAGSFVTNYCSGGWDPMVAETALRFGARILYMPTVSTEHFIKRMGMANGGGESRPLGAYPHPAETPAGYPLGMTVLTAERTIKPEIHEILRLVKEYDVTLGTGHLASSEIFPLIEAAHGHGIERIIVTHVTFPVIGDLDRGRWQELAAAGVVFEHAYQNTKALPRIKKPYPVTRMVADIMALGPEHCIFSTNYGAPSLPKPHQGMLDGIAELIDNGLPADAVRQIVRDTPRRAFGFG